MKPRSPAAASSGVGDELLVLLDRFDEEPLALGKQQRQRVQERRLECIVAAPVARNVRGSRAKSTSRRGIGHVIKCASRRSIRPRSAQAEWLSFGATCTTSRRLHPRPRRAGGAWNVTPTALLAGLPIAAAARRPATRVPLRVCEAIVARAHELTHEPALAFHVGTQMRAVVARLPRLRGDDRGHGARGARARDAGSRARARRRSGSRCTSRATRVAS